MINLTREKFKDGHLSGKGYAYHYQTIFEPSLIPYSSKTILKTIFIESFYLLQNNLQPFFIQDVLYSLLIHLTALTHQLIFQRFCARSSTGMVSGTMMVRQPLDSHGFSRCVCILCGLFTYRVFIKGTLK